GVGCPRRAELHVQLRRAATSFTTLSAQPPSGARPYAQLVNLGPWHASTKVGIECRPANISSAERWAKSGSDHRHPRRTAGREDHAVPHAGRGRTSMPLLTVTSGLPSISNAFGSSQLSGPRGVQQSPTPF